MSLAHSMCQRPQGCLPPAAVEGLLREWAACWTSEGVEDQSEVSLLLPSRLPGSLQLSACMGLCLSLAARKGVSTSAAALGQDS